MTFEKLEIVLSLLSGRMASSADIKLTDLPLLTLAHIAALTSRRRLSKVANFDFQVVCEAENLRLLQPLRKCCRILRDAAHLAIGGICVDYEQGARVTETGVIYDPGNRINFLTSNDEAPPAGEVSIKLDCLRSLPCLREFEASADILPNQIAEVIARVPNLKQIFLSGETDEESDEESWELEAFSSCLTVEELLFCNFHSPDSLLLFPLPNLRSLELIMMSYAPWVPKQASRALRRVVWEGDIGDHDLGKLLKNLLEVPQLHCLILRDCSLEGMLELGAGDKFRAVQTLGLCLSLYIHYEEVRLLDYSHWVAPALNRGCFPALRYLEVWIDAASVRRGVPRLTDLESVFRACAARLEKLHICAMGCTFTEDDAAMLRSLNWSQNLDMRITMRDRKIDGSRYGEVYTMANIARLPLLTTLTMSFANICSLEELFTHPRLARVSFHQCRFQASEVQGLEEEWASLENLVFEDCEEVNENDGRKILEEDPHPCPFPLLVEEHGY